MNKLLNSRSGHDYLFIYVVKHILKFIKSSETFKNVVIGEMESPIYSGPLSIGHQPWFFKVTKRPGSEGPRIPCSPRSPPHANTGGTSGFPAPDSSPPRCLPLSLRRSEGLGYRGSLWLQRQTPRPASSCFSSPRKGK